jgi:hypothetical protein
MSKRSERSHEPKPCDCRPRSKPPVGHSTSPGARALRSPPRRTTKISRGPSRQAMSNPAPARTSQSPAGASRSPGGTSRAERHDRRSGRSASRALKRCEGRRHDFTTGSPSLWGAQPPHSIKRLLSPRRRSIESSADNEGCAGATRAPKSLVNGGKLQFQFFTLQQDVDTNRRLSVSSRSKHAPTRFAEGGLAAPSICVAPASPRSSTERDPATLAAAVLTGKGWGRRHFQSPRKERRPRARSVTWAPE